MDFIIKKIVKKAVKKIFPESVPKLVKLNGFKGSDKIKMSVLCENSNTVQTKEISASSQNEFNTISKFLNDNEEVCLICPMNRDKVIIKLTNNGKTEIL